MKKTLTIITLMTLVACGKQSDINKLYDKIDSINDRIAKLESDIDGQVIEL